jgi:hypothetical protein
MTKRTMTESDPLNNLAATEMDRPTLVERCLPALEVLKKHGLTTLTLLMWFEDGGSSWEIIQEPCVLNGFRVPMKCRDEVVDAYSAVVRTIEEAIASAIEGDELENEHFLAGVYVAFHDEPQRWTIDCTVREMLDHMHSEFGIRVK